MEFDKPVMKSELSKKIILNKPSVVHLVDEWISLIETETTDRMCKCEWTIHPEDVDVPENGCRVCNAPQGSQMHDVMMSPEEFHPFQGRRKMRSGSEHPECPVHSKSGLILGFLEWAVETKNGG